MRTVYLIVSTVGTMISLNMASLDIGAVSLRSSVHDDHFPAPCLVEENENINQNSEHINA